MDHIDLKESKLIEELYMSFQLVLLIIFASMAFPLLNKNKHQLTFYFSIALCVYIAAKAVLFIRNIYILEKELPECPSRLISILDGILVGFLIYIQQMKNTDMFDLLYVYVIIQSIRYHKTKTVMFSTAASAIHLVVAGACGKENIFGVNVMASIIIYYAIGFIVRVPLQHMNSLREDRRFFYKEMEKKNEKLKKLASTDYLTNLNNHQFFYSYFNDLKDRAYLEKEMISLTLIDIDNFKNINDTYGHLAGDKILREMAEILKGSIRGTDFAARYGGEEFVILFPNTDILDAVRLSERIRKRIEEHQFRIDGHVIRITVSMGADTMLPDDMVDLYNFIKNVDGLLYKAKTFGKNQVQYRCAQKFTASGNQKVGVQL